MKLVFFLLTSFGYVLLYCADAEQKCLKDFNTTTVLINPLFQPQSSTVLDFRSKYAELIAKLKTLNNMLEKIAEHQKEDRNELNRLQKKTQDKNSDT